MNRVAGLRTLPALLGLAMAVGCGSRVVEPPAHQPGIQFLSGTGASDTISATVNVPTQLRVFGASGEPAVGVEVAFDGVDPETHLIHLFISPTGQLANASWADTATTDAQGRVQTSVIFWTFAGDAFLRVTVPSLGFRDSARYTIRPGNPTHLDVSPADTAVLVGNTVALHGTVRDRSGNTRVEPVNFTTTSGPVTTTASGVVTGAGIGRGTLQAAGGGLIQAAAVSVVPNATVAAYMFRFLNDQGSASLVLMRSDGAQLRTIVPLGAAGFEFPPQFGAWPAWLPATGEILFIDGGQLKATTEAGVVRTLFQGSPPAFDYGPPQLSPDGAWIYFTRGRWGLESSMWKVHPDGTSLTAVADTATSPGYQSNPSLNPAGDQLVFQTGPWFQGGLRVMDLGLSKGNSIGVQGSWPSWSPDGAWIAYMANDRSVRLTSPDGVTDALVTEGLTVIPGFAWSPDGQWLLLLDQSPIALPTPQLFRVATREVLPLAFHYPGFYSLYQFAWKP